MAAPALTTTAEGLEHIRTATGQPSRKMQRKPMWVMALSII